MDFAVSPRLILAEDPVVVNNSETPNEERLLSDDGDSRRRLVDPDR